MNTPIELTQEYGKIIDKQREIIGKAAAALRELSEKYCSGGPECQMNRYHNIVDELETAIQAAVEKK